MDREGIDVSVLFPTIGLYIMWRDDIDPELSAAICRAYNTWLADYCDHDRKRLHGVMLIPLQDPARAVEELKYAREKLGLVGIFWRPNKFCGRTLASPEYYPIYETAADLGVTICVHEGARTILPQAGSDRYSEFGRHIACHPLEQMLACLNFCADGVLEKFPKLKVALPRIGLRLGAVLARAHGRALGARIARLGEDHQGKAEPLLQAKLLGELRSGRRAGADVYRARRRRLFDDRNRLSAQRRDRQIPRQDRRRDQRQQ